VIYDMNAKNVLTPSNWAWSSVLAAEPELANLPQPAWLTQGATGRVALLDTKEYPQKNLYTTNMVNLQPRLGVNWAYNDKTVVHLSAGTIDQGLNGLSTDWLSFYYNTNTFNQVDTTDGCTGSASWATIMDCGRSLRCRKEETWDGSTHIE